VGRVFVPAQFRPNANQLTATQSAHFIPYPTRNNVILLTSLYYIIRTI